MTDLILSYVKEIKNRIGIQKKILEVGSLDMNGSVRQFFLDADEYIGIDQDGGKSVDVVMNAHDIDKNFNPESFDCVICCETFEHDPAFWISLEAMRWVLKPGGWMIISMPSLGQKLHRYPMDYWRCMPDAFNVFFAGFEEVITVSGYPVDEKTKERVCEDDTTLIGYGRKPL